MFIVEVIFHDTNQIISPYRSKDKEDARLRGVDLLANYAGIKALFFDDTEANERSVFNASGEHLFTLPLELGVAA